jgi:hypothetical protein
MVKRLRTMKLSDAMWTAVQAKAVEDGVSATAVVEQAVGEYLLIPGTVRKARPGVAEAICVSCEPVSAGPAVCRCGHPEEKHTPRCYVMACVCRGYRV